MAHRVKNNSTHAQGLRTLNRGTVYVAAGTERTLELADVARARRFGFLDITEIDAKVPAPSPEIAEAIAKAPRPTDGQGSFSDEREPQPKAKPVRRRRKRRAKAKP